MKKPKITFDRISFFNRWKQRKYSRNCDWIVFGLAVWWVGPESYCYRLCLFGLELKIWFNREFHLSNK
jgi:hypothetical protein